MFVCNLTRLSPPLLLLSRVAVVSKSFEGQTNKTEEWYGTQYKQEAIAAATLEVNHRQCGRVEKQNSTQLPPADRRACVSEMGERRPQRQVQTAHEERVHPDQLRDLPPGERLSLRPHSDQGKWRPRAAPASKWRRWSSLLRCPGRSSPDATFH